MIAICWKCLYIFELRGRYREYRDRNGFSHRTYRQCPKCRSTKLIVRKSFNLNDTKFILKRIEESDFESVMEFNKVVKPPKSKSRKRSRKPPTIIKPPEPEYQYCMWVNRGCINPQKKIGPDGSSCIKNKLRDDCLLLPDETSQ